VNRRTFFGALSALAAGFGLVPVDCIARTQPRKLRTFGDVLERERFNYAGRNYFKHEPRRWAFRTIGCISNAVDTGGNEAWFGDQCLIDCV
jgi:hypothetical protein